MEYIKHYEDYLFEEIQKHLLELEELTTDVSYREIVYKTIINYIDNEDIITYAKQNFKTNIEFLDLDYFDYKRNNSKFVLQEIINTLNFIKSCTKHQIKDKPNEFFTKIFKRMIIKDSKNNHFKFSSSQKIKMVDTNRKTIYCQRANSVKIEDNVKATTVSSKL